MTVSVVIMIIIGILFIIASFFVTENLFSKESNTKSDLFTVDDNYEFSDRELQIIKRKIEDVIAKHAKDILYDTNESLSNMANEKTMALGDYAVAVCDEIEKNHKEVMFLYSMLDDKQKEIMNTVKSVDAEKNEVKEIYNQVKAEQAKLEEISRHNYSEERRQQMQLEQIISGSKDNESALNSIHAMQSRVNNTTNGNISAPHSDESDSILLNVSNNVAKADDDINTTSDSSNHNGDTFNNSSSHTVTDNSDKGSVDASSAHVSSDNDAGDDFEDIFSEIDQTDIDFDEVLDNDFKEDSNANDIILEMYSGGSTIIQIAKELGLGVGEVKLVIDLYKGDK